MASFETSVVGLKWMIITLSIASILILPEYFVLVAGFIGVVWSAHMTIYSVSEKYSKLVDGGSRAAK